jgi:transcription antitermination factor NusA-like protein
MRTNPDSLGLPLYAHFNKNSINPLKIVKINHAKFLKAILKQQIPPISTKIHEFDFIFQIDNNKLLFNFCIYLIDNDFIKLTLLQSDH